MPEPKTGRLASLYARFSHLETFEYDPGSPAATKLLLAELEAQGCLVEREPFSTVLKITWQKPA